MLQRSAVFRKIPSFLPSFPEIFIRKNSLKTIIAKILFPVVLPLQVKLVLQHKDKFIYSLRKLPVDGSVPFWHGF